jgi:hypothetical protein
MFSIFPQSTNPWLGALHEGQVQYSQQSYLFAGMQVIDAINVAILRPIRAISWRFSRTFDDFP